MQLRFGDHTFTHHPGVVDWTHLVANANDCIGV